MSSIGAPLLQQEGGNAELVKPDKFTAFYHDKPFNEKTNQPFPLWSSSISTIEPVIGFGAAQFLRFERALAITLFVMSIFAVGQILYAALWNPYNPATSYHRYISVSNFGDTVPLSYVFIGFASSIVFICYTIWVRQNLAIRNPIYFNAPRAASYTVEVSNLPPTATEQSVKEYFEKNFGQVANVAIALDNGDLLNYIEQVKQLKQLAKVMQLNNKSKTGGWCCGLIAPTRIETIREKIADYSQKVVELQQLEYKCCGYAYVTFEMKEHAVKCRKEFLNEQLIITPDKLPLFEGKKLHVIGAPDSEDVIWKNLQHGTWSQTWRHLVTILVSYFCISIALAISFGSAQPTIRLHLNIIIVQLVSFTCQAINLAATIIIFILVPMFADFEKHHRNTRIELFVFIRIFIFDILTTVGVSCLAFGFFAYGREGNDTFIDAFIPTITMVIELTVFR